MKNIAQITQEELIQLIAEKISADGFKVIPSEYTVQFVTSADGQTSALITGVVKDPDVADAVPEGGATVVASPTQELPAGLERSARVALQVVLTFKPQTQEKLVKKVLETLLRESGGQPGYLRYDNRHADRLGGTINAFVITALQAWAQEGKLSYVEDIDSWHKKRPPAAQAAADVLGGTGSAMGRGDALGEGVTGNRRRGH